MRYFVGVSMPKELQVSIDALRSSYPGRLVRHVEPHVTLVPPVEVPEIQPFLSALRTVCDSHEPFLLPLGQPDTFGKRVLFLSVDRQTGIDRLRAALYTGTQELFQARGWPLTQDARPFHPHLTLAMSSFGTSQDAMLQMREEAQLLASTLLPVPVTAVRVYRREAGGWQQFTDLALRPSDRSARSLHAHNPMNS